MPLKLPPMMLKDRKQLERYVHEVIFPKVSSIHRAYLAQFFTEFFSDGFESGNFSAWSGNNGSPTVSSSQTHNGSYSMLCDDADKYVYATITGQTTIFGRCYIRTDAVPGNNIRWEFIGFGNGAGSEIGSAGLVNDSGTIKPYVSIYSGGTWPEHFGSGITWNTDTWYCFEFELVINNSNGECHVWIDGSEELTWTGLDTYDSDRATATTAIFGEWWIESGTAPTAYFDDCVVADTYNGPETYLIFSDGFESGDFSAFDRTSGSPTIDDTKSHHETYSALISNSDYAQKDLASSHDDIFVREYVYFNSLVNNVNYGHDIMVVGSSTAWSYAATVRVQCINTDDRRLGMYSGGTSYTYGSTHMSAGQWYCIELRRRTGGADSYLYLDGNLEVTIASAQYYDADRVQVGGSSQLSTSLNIDCVVVADAYIGTEEGSTLVEVTDSLSLNEAVANMQNVEVADLLSLSEAVTADIASPTWNGGTVTNDIKIEKATPVLQLKNTSANPELHFNDGANLMKIYGSTTPSPHLVVDSDITLEQDVTMTNLDVVSELTLNGSAGNSGQVLTSSGSGSAPTWQTVSGGSGFITSIAAGQPFTVSSGALSLNVSSPLQIASEMLLMLQANGSTDGYLSSSDWNTFNNKQNALTTGNLTGTANQVNVSGGTGSIIGSGVTLSLPQNIHTGASPTFAGLTINSNRLTVDNVIRMMTPDGQNYIDIQAISGGPILQISQAVWVKDDLSLYGFLGSSTDPEKGSGGGAIMMGHGFTSMDDEPQFILLDTVGGGSGATAELTVTNGVITDVTIANQGSNYRFADVTINSNTGEGARLAPVINGPIQSIAINNSGVNYSSSDTVQIIGDGSGASATLTVNNGIITAVNVTDQGDNYSYASIQINTTNGSRAQLVPIINGKIRGINRFNGGKNYSGSDTVSITNNPHNTLYLKQRNASGLTVPANLDLGDLIVHGDLTVDGTLYASIALSSFSTGFFTGVDGLAKFASGIFTGENGLAKFADSFFGGVTGLAKFATGLFTADAAGRAKFADGIITASQIEDSTITGSKIAGSTITNSNFVDGTIEGSKIHNSTLANSLFVDGTIEGSKIHASTLTNSLFVDGTIEGAKIHNSTLTNAHIVDGTIENAKIHDGTIQNAKIANLDAGKISTGYLSASRLNTAVAYISQTAMVNDLVITSAKLAEALGIYSSELPITVPTEYIYDADTLQGQPPYHPPDTWSGTYTAYLTFTAFKFEAWDDIKHYLKKITVQAKKDTAGTSTNPTIQFQYSTNSGSSWSDFGNAITVSAVSYTEYSATDDVTTDLDQVFWVRAKLDIPWQWYWWDIYPAWYPQGVILHLKNATLRERGFKGKRGDI
jgi:uncharacterized protein YjbI with pentapeptide repeats